MKRDVSASPAVRGGLEAIRALRQSFSDLHEQIEQLASNSRERSVALTHLETAAMWAIKALVMTDPESKAVV